MSNNNKPSDYVRLDQLLTKDGLLRYCRTNNRGSTKLDINKGFLDVAEKEKFIKPITNAEGIVVNKEGEQAKKMIPYYSPFQIYIIACLSKNAVVDNQLRSGEDLNYQKSHGMRLLCWGWGGLRMNISLANTGANYHPRINDIYQYCNHYHSFLTLLHTFESDNNDYQYRNKMRLFSGSPSINYDFSPAKGMGEKALMPFELTLETLRLLRKDVGELALKIDPLELWFHYVRKHPRLKKDLLKGDAQLAQEVYMIEEMLTELIETITSEKELGLLEFIYQDGLLPMLVSRSDFASGTDVKALWSSINKFRNWVSKKENKKLTPDGMLKRLSSFEKSLKEFESKYGDKSYVSGISRDVEYEEKLEIQDLDPAVSKYVGQIPKQDRERDNVKDEEEIKRLIAFAIERRLSELSRELWKIFDEVGGVLQKKASGAWNTANNFGNYYWLHREKGYEKLSREKQQKIYMKEEQKARKKAVMWGNKRDDFSEILKDMRYIFCQHCKERPVKIKGESGDQITYNSFICDECIKNPEVIMSAKLGEWKCYECGKMLYKFNYENKIRSQLLNGAESNTVLEYGRLKLTVTCGDKNCKQINTRWVDWGWSP